MTEEREICLEDATNCLELNSVNLGISIGL